MSTRRSRTAGSCFNGGPADICRANLWLRTSDRVLVKMAEFPATTFEELFEGAKAINWPDWIPEDGEFPGGRTLAQIAAHSVPACQSIVKKAVVEKMKTVYGTEWFQRTAPGTSSRCRC